MIHWRMMTTQDKIEAIRSVWFSGCSSAQIAAKLEDVTRNAVIGIYHRWGPSYLFDKPLDSPARAHGSRERKDRAYVVKVPRTMTRKPLPEPVFVATESHLCGKPLMMLRPRECKFPVNDATRDELHLFCAIPTDLDRSYCQHHIGRAYRERPAR